MDEFKYKERIVGAEEAIKRSRWVFLALTVVSLSILMTGWNAYFSWDRSIPLDNHAWSKDEVAAFAQQRLVEGWVKSQMIDVPLLGIHIGISDAAPLGAVAVFILSIWFYFSARRENHTIGSLLRDTKDESLDVRSRIFHGIAAYLVFLTITPGDDPIRSIEGSAAQQKPSTALRFAAKALLFLAPFAVFFIVCCDALTIFWLRSPYRAGHLPLFEATEISGQEWLAWGLLEVVALLLAAWTAFLCWRALRFEEATGQVLKEYADKLSSQPA